MPTVPHQTNLENAKGLHLNNVGHLVLKKYYLHSHIILHRYYLLLMHFTSRTSLGK